jgi:hypothetical protein
VAAYAEGVDADRIAQRYGVTRDDVEQIIAGQTGATEAASAPRRAPAPIVAAMLIVVLYGIVQLIAGTSHPAVTPGFAAASIAIGGTIYTLITVGIWRGWQVAQWLAALGGALAVVTGIGVNAEPSPLRLLGGALLIGLLFVPVQSRDWFARRR